MIVIDTNVVAYLLIHGQHTAAARATFARDPEWAAPLLWRSEFRNLLALYLRRHDLSLRQALSLQEAAESLVVGREHLGASNEVLALANDSGRSASDCEFIAVARRLGVPFVTSDRQLLASFPKDAVALQTFGVDVADH